MSSISDRLDDKIGRARKWTVKVEISGNTPSADEADIGHLCPANPSLARVDTRIFLQGHQCGFGGKAGLTGMFTCRLGFHCRKRHRMTHPMGIYFSLA